MVSLSGRGIERENERERDWKGKKEMDLVSQLAAFFSALGTWLARRPAPILRGCLAQQDANGHHAPVIAREGYPSGSDDSPASLIGVGCFGFDGCSSPSSRVFPSKKEKKTFFLALSFFASSLAAAPSMFLPPYNCDRYDGNGVEHGKRVV